MRLSSLLFASLISSSLWGEIRFAPAESLTQEQAGEYCRSFGTSWRLMSIGEIYALPKNTSFNPDYSYWSNDETAADNSQIGTGSEGDGGQIPMLGYSFYPKERNITLSPGWKRISAACTNQPKAERKREYLLSKEGTLDQTSGLLWHSLDATDKRAKYTFEKAKEMCENLALGGRTWRLPSVEELYGIVDYRFSRPTVDMHYFGVMMQRYYWTADSLNDKEAYVVGFKLGGVATAPKKEEIYARCVSDE
ncbi:MAG: DUF1566 domain-containing protein [Sulfuricurvum sp.]|uniref:Lcl C-terminal domain-containing protein n=1 Tax=Sulfuricurvum sp. TaxID=2025608 RepID=UPI003564859A